MIININTKKKYTVEIGENLLNDIGYKVSKLTSPKSKVCIITDVNVDKLYMHRLEESLTNQSFFIHKLVFESGENIKNINSLERILNYLSHEHFNKGDIIIAFGGGMIGDLAGFAASVYHRGIPYIQIPTTLLAAVDSSIGGKTAINLSSGKNTIGNLWNPTAVYFDIKTLETLEKKELQNGISEIIKAAIIGDKYLFELFEKNSPKNLANFIFEALVRAIYVKKKIIEMDESDKHIRKLLNLGHTIGHSVEVLSDYNIPHGIGVAIGIVSMAQISEKKGWAHEAIFTKILNVFENYNIQHSCNFTSKSISNVALLDKKATRNMISLVIPCGIGSCKSIEIPLNNLESLFALGLEG